VKYCMNNSHQYVTSTLIFGDSCPSFNNVNIMVTGECEAQVINKGQICVRKHRASPSCFQRTGISVLFAFFLFLSLK